MTLTVDRIGPERYCTNVDFLGSLYKHRAIQTWLRDRPEGWVITSGDWSPFYFAFRDVPSYPELFAQATRLLADAMQPWEGSYDRVIGVATTGIALTGAVAHSLRVPMGFTRKVVGVRSAEDLANSTSAWGGHSIVEGVMNDGDRILVLDDVLSTFTSKATAIAQIQAEAQQRGVTVEVVGVAVVVDRGPESRPATPVPVTAALTLRDHLDSLISAGATARETEVIGAYLHSPTEFQAEIVRKKLEAEALAMQRVAP